MHSVFFKVQVCMVTEHANKNKTFLFHSFLTVKNTIKELFLPFNAFFPPTILG
jgi:hypothetical protein